MTHLKTDAALVVVFTMCVAIALHSGNPAFERLFIDLFYVLLILGLSRY